MKKTIETLIKGKNSNSEERWYPTAIDSFRDGLMVMQSDVKGFHPLVDNIAYNLQYVQFLDKELKELELSSVLRTMLIKSYVIAGIGIIEGIFSYIIKSRGWWKTKDEEVVLSSKAQQKNGKGEEYIVRTEISVKCVPVEDKMTLDEMIKCLNRHHGALKIDHLLYPQVSRIRDLRNRVHLQKSDIPSDHDYNAFDETVHGEMKSILYQVLCSPSVTAQDKLSNYDFLR